MIFDKEETSSLQSVLSRTNSHDARELVEYVTSLLEQNKEPDYSIYSNDSVDLFKGNGVLHILTRLNTNQQHDELIKKLLEHAPYLVRSTNHDGETALAALLTSYENHQITVENLLYNACILIEHGASAKVCSKKGLPLIHLLALANTTQKFVSEIQKLFENKTALEDCKASLSTGRYNGYGSKMGPKDVSTYLIDEDLQLHIDTLLLLAAYGIGRERLLHTFLTDPELYKNANKYSNYLKQLIVNFEKPLCQDGNLQTSLPIDTLNIWYASEVKKWYSKSADLFSEYKNKALMLADFGVDISATNQKDSRSLLELLIQKNNTGTYSDDILRLLGSKGGALLKSKAVEIVCSLCKTDYSYKNTWEYSRQESANKLNAALLTAKSLASSGLTDNPEDVKKLLSILLMNNTNNSSADAISRLIEKNPSIITDDPQYWVKFLLEKWLKNSNDRNSIGCSLMLLYNAGADLLATVTATENAENNQKMELSASVLDVLSLSDIDALIQKDRKFLDIKNRDGHSYLVVSLLSEPTAKNVQKLADYGASFQYLNEQGESLLHLLMRNYKTITDTFLQAMISHGVDLSVKTHAGQTLFHYYLEGAFTDPDYQNTLGVLEQNNVDLNAKDEKGDTALHVFLAKGNFIGNYMSRYPDVFNWVLSHGANIWLKNKKGSSCAMMLFKDVYHNFDAAMQCVITQSNDPLLKAINDMYIYAKKLCNDQESYHYGRGAEELAQKLMAFVVPLYNEDGSLDVDKFPKDDFLQMLHSQDDEMREYRQNWDTIKANILIALTGVGLIAIAGKLVYSTVTEGRPLFFWQSPKTTRETLRENIEKAIPEKQPKN